MPTRPHRDLGLWTLIGGLLAVGVIFAAVIGYAPAPAASGERVTAPTLVKVTAGKPAEFAFTLSRSSAIPAGAITFKVTNLGTLAHGFKVCTTPATGPKANSCRGLGTALVLPGRSASLTVTLPRAGTYEFLSTTPAHAAKGMKGSFAVVLAAPSSGSSTTVPAVTTPRTGTTTTPPSTSGDTSAGAALFVSDGCSSCHSLADVRGFGTTIGPNLNTSHPMPFPNGPLSTAQLTDLAAYINGR